MRDRPVALRVVPPAGPVSPGGRPGRAVRSGRGAPAPLRLTRRGRVVVRGLAVLLFVSVVVGVVLMINRPAAADPVARPVPVTYRLVLPGESLLQIAAEVNPRADARDVAVRIARLNALDSWSLDVGQLLALPVES